LSREISGIVSNGHILAVMQAAGWVWEEKNRCTQPKLRAHWRDGVKSLYGAQRAHAVACHRHCATMLLPVLGAFAG